MNIDDAAPDSAVLLCTPWLDLSQLTACNLVFMQRRSSGWGYVDSLKVLVRTSASGSWQQLASYGTAMSSWTECTLSLPAGTETCQVAFSYIFNYGGDCRLDEVYVGEPLTCKRVSGLHATDVDGDSVTLVWHDTANVGASYNVRWRNYSDVTMQTVVTDTMLRIGGLGGGTFYRFDVSAACSDGAQSLPTECSLRTAADIVHIPYYEKFNDLYNYTPAGWTTLCGQWHVEHWGNHSPMLTSRTGHSLIVFPPTDHPTNDLQLRLHVGGYDEPPMPMPYGTLSVGYMTNPNDSTSFVSVVSWPSSECYFSEERAVLFSSAPATARIALLWEASPVLYNEEVFVDDIVIEQIPACTRPTGVSVVATFSSSIDISIGGMVDRYRVYWSDSLTVDSADVFDSVYTIMGLSENTGYVISVVTLCTDGSRTPPVIVRARTRCGVVSVPYLEDFEAYPLTGMPYCWTVLNGRSYITGYGLFGHSASTLFFQGATFNAVALPRFDMPTDTLQVRFYLKPAAGGYASSGTFSVGWQTNLDDSSTFVAMDSWTSLEWPMIGAYEKAVPMYNAPDTAYIVMRAQLNNPQSWWAIDSVVVEPMPSCPPPTRFDLTGIGYDTISVSFSGGRTGNYRLCITDGDMYYDTVHVSGVNCYTFTGLDTITAYTITLTSDCGSEVSDSLVLRATTEMPASTLPYYTGFEPGDDVAWRLLFSNNDNEWYIGSAVNHGGSHSLYITDDGGVSNHYYPGEGYNPYFSNSYAYKTFWFDAPAEYHISYDWLSTGQLLGWMRVMIAPASFEVNTDYRLSNINAPAGWICLDSCYYFTDTLWHNYSQLFKIDTPGYYHLIVYWFSGNTYYGEQPSCAIDNVLLERISCPAVSDVVVDSIDRRSATIRWTPYGAESEWEVTVGDNTAYVSAPVYHATGLSPTTSYTATVRPVCGVGDTGLPASTWFATALCERAVVMTNYDSVLQELSLADSPLGDFFDDYSYFQTIVPASRFSTQGSSIEAFAFKPWGGNSSGAYLYGMDIYMANVRENNLNDGFILPDSTHRFVKVVSDAELTFLDNTWHTYRFDSIFEWDGYSNVLFAAHRTQRPIRVSNYLPSYDAHRAYQGAVRGMSSDSPIDIYEVSGGWPQNSAGDLRFISCPAGCDVPAITDLVAEADNVTISFEAQDTVEVAILAGTWDDAAEGMLMVPAVGRFTFTGLSPMTHYYVGIRQICDDSTFSEWVVMPVTTLDMGCLPPTDFALGAGGIDEQTFSWTPADNETAWQIHIFNGTRNTMHTFGATTATVDDLYGGTTYQASVRSLCGPDGDMPGPWGDTLTFTTDDCPMVQQVAVGSITSSTARVNWQPVAGSLGYRVYYGMENFFDVEATVVDVDAATTTLELTGLNGSTTYEVFVLNRCTSTLYSGVAEGQRVPFTTLAGIEDVEGGDIALYPNPADESVTLKISGLDGAIRVQVVDINGRENGRWLMADGELTIDVSHYAPGAYFVRLTNARQTIVRKLIVR